MKDYRVVVSIKNNHLRSRMESAGFETGAELSRASGVPANIISAYMTLRRAPLGPKGWHAAALQLSAALCCEPEDLFPAQHVQKAMAKSSVEFEASLEDIQLLVQDRDQTMDRDAISYAMSNLTERQKSVISRRIKGETFEEIGEVLGVSRERVRQIESRSYHRMRTELVRTVGGNGDAARRLYLQ